MLARNKVVIIRDPLQYHNTNTNTQIHIYDFILYILLPIIFSHKRQKIERKMILSLHSSLHYTFILVYQPLPPAIVVLSSFNLHTFVLNLIVGGNISSVAWSMDTFYTEIEISFRTSARGRLNKTCLGGY